MNLRNRAARGRGRRGRGAEVCSFAFLVANFSSFSVLLPLQNISFVPHCRTAMVVVRPMLPTRAATTAVRCASSLFSACSYFLLHAYFYQHSRSSLHDWASFPCRASIMSTNTVADVAVVAVVADVAVVAVVAVVAGMTCRYVCLFFVPPLTSAYNCSYLFPLYCRATALW